MADSPEADAHSDAERVWSDVDRYIGDHLGVDDEVLSATLRDSVSAGLPEIAVSPPQGKLLMLLAASIGARRILEIGTLGGYSTIWLARGLADGGQIITCEYSAEHALVAGENLQRAGVADRVDIRVGPAIDTLPTLEGPFDLSFIDADKESNADYFRWALQLSRPGSLIIVDNTVREGVIVDDSNDDPMIVGTRRLYEAVRDEPRVAATAVQTVGSKGYDGFLLARVL
jgi:predicted O-methyltransferase YrrM